MSSCSAQGACSGSGDTTAPRGAAGCGWEVRGPQTRAPSAGLRPRQWNSSSVGPMARSGTRLQRGPEVRATAPAIALLLGLPLLVGPANTGAAAPVTIPMRLASTVPLPQDRLHFGLANQPTDLSWMTSSGVPWRYRYQYLAGGVNTGQGWETWNSPAGAFAANYMNASSANGYVPVFPYYELLQSTPSSGATESDRDFSNLNNPSTMAAYFANFKLLMQTAGSFGKTVVVHVEPDLWGYLQQRAGSGDASSLSASVASSGFAEAAGLPNTAQGFAYELLKLRDSYAPNATLAIHASGWASGIDINSDTNPNVSAAA